MKITLHVDMEDRDLIALMQIAGFKGITTEEVVIQAIREYVMKEAQSFRPEPEPEPEARESRNRQESGEPASDSKD